MRYVVGFGRFWYDFIVGDSIVLAIGGAGALALGALLVANGAGAITEWLLPTTVVVTLAVSLRGQAR
ncbi:MAG: hypothetical protein Q8M65_07330 [Rhodoglobus sp.]|nr:hypothetical protein [Rhodoglobus sp.]